LVWLKFLVCLLVILFAGTKLARYGDVIAEKTGLGRLWVGMMLLALITSMPEMVTGISAAALVKLPDLAIGDFFGSCLFNLTIIALLDIIYRPSSILSQASKRHLLPAFIGIVLIVIASIGIIAGEWLSGISLLGVGIASILVFIVYVFGIRKVFYNEQRIKTDASQPTQTLRYEDTGKKEVYIKFALASLAIIGSGIWLAFIGEEISTAYNLSNSFVGSLFLAITTSLPELVVAITAIRIGAIDMAIADILGANMLNMVNIFSSDIFYRQGVILSSVSKDHLIAAAGVLVAVVLVIIGIRFRQPRKTFKFISWYSIALIAIYLSVSYLIYSVGSG